jgi:putative peptidoglycan lipid II flippase
MVSRFIKLMHSEVSGIHHAALLLAGFTFISQLLGVARDRLLAHTFGAGQLLDAYYAAFRIPDFIYAAIGSLVSISVLIPFLSKHLEKEDKRGVKILLDSVLTVFLTLMVVVCLLCFYFAPYLVEFLFKGFNPDVHNLTISLTRILLLQPIFLGLSNVLGVITQMKKRFLLYSLSPVLYNISILFGLVFLYPIFGLTGVAWGVVIGACIHFAIQIPFAYRQHLLPSFVGNVNFKEVFEVMKVSIPRTFTLSMQQIQLLVIASYASLLTVGSLSVYTLALNLQNVPLSLIGGSYAMAAFPTLSKHYASGNKETYIGQVINALRHIMFWVLPIAVLFIVLRAQIVRTVLGSGSFSWNDTRLTAAVLAIFSLSLLAQTMTLLIVRAYYAAGKTIVPLIISGAGALVGVVLPYMLLYSFKSSVAFRVFFESLFKVQDISGTEVLMLPLGYAIGAIVSLIVFICKFNYDFGGVFKKIYTAFIHSLGASVLCGGATYVSLQYISSGIKLTTGVGVFLQGCIAGVIGLFVWIAVHYVQKSDEFAEVFAALRQRVRKDKLIIRDQD